jgi:choline monooxygenase
MEPLGPRRMRLVYSFFRPAGVSEKDFEATFEYGMEVSREDQWITPLVQKNLEAGVYEKGPLSPKHENGVYYFHELVRAALAN